MECKTILIPKYTETKKKLTKLQTDKLSPKYLQRMSKHQEEKEPVSRKAEGML